jgi:hypothetical protein
VFHSGPRLMRKPVTGFTDANRMTGLTIFFVFVLQSLSQDQIRWWMHDDAGGSLVTFWISQSMTMCWLVSQCECYDVFCSWSH